MFPEFSPHKYLICNNKDIYRKTNHFIFLPEERNRCFWLVRYLTAMDNLSLSKFLNIYHFPWVRNQWVYYHGPMSTIHFNGYFTRLGNTPVISMGTIPWASFPYSFQWFWYQRPVSPIYDNGYATRGENTPFMSMDMVPRANFPHSYQKHGPIGQFLFISIGDATRG